MALLVLPFGQIVPDSIELWLTYIDGNYLRSNSGALYLVYALNVNNCPDVDPLILSGSVTGFKEWLTFYRNWRVLDIRHDFSIVNNETFPVIWGMVMNETTIVSLPANRDQAVSFLEGDRSSGARILAGNGGMNKDSWKKSYNLGKDIVGNSEMYRTSSIYEGTGTTNISTDITSSLVVASTGGSNLINGVSTTWNLHMRVRFYNRVPLSD
jgi:hypothetical protein